MKTNNTNTNTNTNTNSNNNPKTNIKKFLSNPNLLYAKLGFDKKEFFQILNTEFQKYGKSFLNIFDVKNLFGCDDYEAYSIIYIYTKKYGLPMSSESEIIRWKLENPTQKRIKYRRHPGDDVVIKMMTEKFNEKGQNFLNYKNVSALFQCGDVRARKYIKLFCKNYKLVSPLKTFKIINTEKNRQKIIAEYNANSQDISILSSTQFVRKKLNCNRQTAEAIIRKICQELQITCPLKTHKKRDFNEKYLLLIDQEYAKNGLDGLVLNTLSPLAANVFGKKDGVCFRHELAKHIRQYAKLYELNISNLNLKVK